MEYRLAAADGPIASVTWVLDAQGMLRATTDASLDADLAVALGALGGVEYESLVSCLATGRINQAGAAAIRLAQRAVHEGDQELMVAAVLAASVSPPVQAGWDDATFALAAVIRGAQVASWDIADLIASAAPVIGPERARRIQSMAGYSTPILEVAGMQESFGADGWTVY